jgi:hypothetical protein
MAYLTGLGLLVVITAPVFILLTGKKNPKKAFSEQHNVHITREDTEFAAVESSRL